MVGLVFTPEKLNWCPDVAPNGDFASPFVVAVAVVDGVPKLRELGAALDDGVPKEKPEVAAFGVVVESVLEVVAAPPPNENPPDEDEVVPEPNLKPPPAPMVMTGLAASSFSFSFLTSSS